MSPEDNDKNIAARFAVDLIKSTLDDGGDESRLLSRAENTILAVFLANERIFRVGRADNLARLDSMFARLSRRLAHASREGG
ncbi:hypothetical protein GCM10007301_12160 [Azorhizobium oxalatiphilum]|uniref:Uncharacterized protein n=1 Tax=Azorhizobium oxalatiphilum TaxID=980631 RepID=A0A917BTU3_9HYPH|nr:hypothetical protein [Azorhizobium oxalatiphilum]GGF54217.1 hypothetical protein GCM10007301_12160 [Azorhizobium oxalatiphilum]